ncbi:MAG: alpha/beta hydrolase, partial [Alphaproteobacteria bacterium]|nr:alpha/beta hydrolase [Alphaproteobacteria bacterium]
DWRGQGLSWRAGDRARRHHDDFALDVADAEAFIARAPLPANLPRIMLAHSMGGQIGLRLLHDRPDLFVAAVMTAPMLGLPVPDWAGGPLAETLCAIGMDESYAPGNGPWSAERMTLGLRLLTSDPERAAMQKYWMTHKPELRMGGVTMQWVRAAFRTMRLAAQPDYLASVHTPCLMVRSGADAVIANPAIDRAARYLPNVEILPVPGALHEVMMERDQYRDLFWAGFEAFTARFI